MYNRRLPRGFSPNAVSNARRRYEQTDEPQQSIADDLGVHRKTLNRLAREQGWIMRKDRPPRDLPGDLSVLLEAEQAVLTEATEHVINEGSALQGSTPRIASERATKTASVSDRLEAAVERELAAVELMRAQLGPQPRPPADAERTARTLERLTDTLFKVRRLRLPGGQPAGASTYDDVPHDVDAFRVALAQRIEAFVRGRADEGLSEGREFGLRTSS